MRGYYVRVHCCIYNDRKFHQFLEGYLFEVCRSDGIIRYFDRKVVCIISGEKIMEDRSKVTLLK